METVDHTVCQCCEHGTGPSPFALSAGQFDASIPAVLSIKAPTAVVGNSVTSVITDGIGDVNSDARGSGARFNTGKVPYELLPLDIVFEATGTGDQDDHPVAQQIIIGLGMWQRDDRHADWLTAAFRAACGGEVTLPALLDAARVFDYGRRKYAEWNWAKGMKWSAPLACAVRHCLAILAGEENDPESGLPHIGHVQCNLLMLLTFAETYPEGDDRPTKWLSLR